MSRAEHAAEAAALYARGALQREIAEIMGLSRSHVSALLNDPDGSKDRARKDSYGGICEQCGRPTSGADGPAQVARFCNHCAPGHNFRIWTKDSVVEAIQEWARRYGRPPTSTEWITRTVADDGYVFPPRTAVYNSNSKGDHRQTIPFDKWADAIEAAGFPRPYTGAYRRKAMPKHTRPYLVFKQNGDGHLALVGETEAPDNATAVEALGDGAGTYAAVAKASLMVFDVAPRLVAARKQT
jgi:hypothetical protein